MLKLSTSGLALSLALLLSVSLSLCAKDSVSMNFAGTDLKDVLKVVHAQTGARFLFDDSLLTGKKVSFYAEQPLPVSELLNTLTSILEVQGLVLVRMGEGENVIFKVVPVKNASRRNTPTFTHENFEEIPDSDEVVTLMYELKYLVPHVLEKPFSKMTSLEDAVTGIEGSSILRITDIASNVKKMVKLIQVMDRKESITESLTLKLEHVQASLLANELKPMVDLENDKVQRELKNRIASTLLSQNAKSQKSRSRSSNKQMNISDFQVTSPIVVTAIDRLNSIYLHGTPQQLEVLTAAIKNLDVPATRRSQLYFIELKHAKASELSQYLTDIFNQSGSPGTSRSTSSSRSKRPSSSKSSKSVNGGAIFRADTSLNRLMVLAAPSEMDEIREVIQKLDQSPMDDLLLKSYPVNHAQPEQLQSVLETMYSSFSRSQSRGKPAAFQMSYDTNTQALWIRTTTELHEEVQEVLTQMDIEGKAQQKVHLVDLQHADPSTLARTLTELFRSKQSTSKSSKKSRGRSSTATSGSPIFRPDPSLGRLAILCSQEELEEILELIKDMDKPAASEALLKSYLITKADPSRVLSVLQQMYAPYTRSKVRGAPPPFQLNYDDSTRQLWVRAIPELHEEVQKVLAQMDNGTEGDMELKFVELEHSDANTLSRTLSSLYAEKYRNSKTLSSKSKGAVAPPTAIFRADPSLSRLAIYASKEEMPEILELVKQMDAPPRDDLILTSYPVNHADPNQMVEVLNRMYAPYTRAQRGKEPTFQLNYDQNMQALWVRTTAELHGEVKEVLNKMDIIGEDRRFLKSYPLEFADISEASKMIREFLNSRVQKSRGRSSTASSQAPVLSTDNNNSALILFADKQTHELVDQALKSIDIVRDGDQIIRYYSLKHLAILDAVHLLNNLFGFQSSVTTPGLRASRGQREKLILDENSGQIVIIASSRTHEKVAKALEELDIPGLGDNILKYYPIENTTADEAARTIQQLFGLPMQTPNSRSRTASTTSRGLALQKNPMVIANLESNTVIVNAPEKTHQAIKELLGSMSEISRVDKMTVRFYPLENTNADEIAGQISELFSLKLGRGFDSTTTQGRNVSNTRKSSGGALLRPMRPEDEEAHAREAQTPMEQQYAPQARPLNERNAFFFDGEPTVIPERNLNSVILVAPSYLHEEVKSTLGTMDKRRPQVMVEVAIIEVADGSDLDFGVELSRSGKHGGGYSNFGYSAPNASSRFPGDGAIKTDLQGLVAGFLRSDGSMPVILSALKKDNRLNIHSTPSLLVNDNEEAIFSSLQEEPTTSTSQGTATTNVSFAGFVQAGTSLTITPHISQGQYIRLEIDLKVESFTGEVVSAGIPPPKSSNSLVTSVTVPDQNLVIIGGMVSERLNDVENKVPVLGDIPGIRHFFKRQIKEKSRARLYLFIRPQILRDESFDDLKALSLKKQGELSKKPAIANPEPKEPQVDSAKASLDKQNQAIKESHQRSPQRI
ncbi:MAG: hypothetical protein HQL32_07730, partial [Planctomycetes bacterium]|nr:hypothetical protein [Planctomycetota bacterium]